MRAFILTANETEYLVLADIPDAARNIAAVEWPEHVDPTNWDDKCQTFQDCPVAEVGIGYARQL